MNMQTSLLRVIFIVGLTTLGAANCVVGQTAPLTTRDADGKLVFQRQNAGAYLGAYLGDAGGKRGAKVGKVLADSPAAKAGLVESDLVIGFASDRIENAAQVYQWLSARKPPPRLNDSVALKVLRNGAELTLNLSLSERRVRGDDPCQKLLSETNAVLSEAERLKALSEEAARKGDKKAAEENAKEAEALFRQAEVRRLDVEQAIAEGRTSTAGRKDTCSPANLQPETAGLGLEVAALTPQLANYFGLKSSSGFGNGLLVTEIFSGTPAAQAGFKAGDCLLLLNEKAVANAVEMRRTFEEASEPMLSASILRDGQSLTLSVKRR